MAPRRHAALGLAVAVAAAAAAGAGAAEVWQEWLSRFGHDDYLYPEWITAQQEVCQCERADNGIRCLDKGLVVTWHEASDLTWCAARHFLLSHMPAFDLDFLPPAVSIQGTSMLDDHIAFALMAWNASALAPKLPIQVAFTYLLPYATFHEARSNWRPLFFAKYFSAAAGLRTSKDVLQALIGDNLQLMNWTAWRWADFSGAAAHNRYELGPFAPSSTPPVVSQFDFLAYGYGSCTAWSKFLASALQAVGVPARETGSPCWNTGEFAGLAVQNPNVSACWAAGHLPGGPVGGKFLNNHNWVEYWDNEEGGWHFVDVSTSSTSESTWFCGTFTNGCDCSSNAGKASRDHEVLSPTWAVPGSDPSVHGGPVLSVAQDLKLSTGKGVSPLVWSPHLRSPLGTPLKDVGLRVVNRTEFYRCKSPTAQPVHVLRV